MINDIFANFFPLEFWSQNLKDFRGYKKHNSHGIERKKLKAAKKIHWSQSVRVLINALFIMFIEHSGDLQVDKFSVGKRIILRSSWYNFIFLTFLYYNTYIYPEKQLLTLVTVYPQTQLGNNSKSRRRNQFCEWRKN